MKRIIFIIPVLLSFLFCFPGNNSAAENEVYIIEISGSINPAVADFLKRGINQASEDVVSCVIIKIDTPGGLAESMREIVKAIFASKVPVVTYVAIAAMSAAMVIMTPAEAALAPLGAT